MNTLSTASTSLVPNPYQQVGDEQDVFADPHGERTVFTHAVFCQCTLPIRALAQTKRFYNVQHGNVALMFQAGHYRDHEGKIHEQCVPSGSKARLLFAYIVDMARRSGYPVVDMGRNLYVFMRRNGIPIGSRNREELVAQVRNITASDISVGMWTQSTDANVSQTKQFKVASTISFWEDKQEQRNDKEWDPIISLSDDFMTILDDHTFEIKFKPLVELQASPRAMDMYMWLTYRVHHLKRSVKISYKNLHGIFGLQTRDIRDFKKAFKVAIEKALPYIPDAEVNFDQEKHHLVISNRKHKLYTIGQKNDHISLGLPEEDVFGDLKDLGLSVASIKKLVKDSQKEDIAQALTITKQQMSHKMVKNPAGFFLKALKGNWELPKHLKAPEVDRHDNESDLVLDYDYEASVASQDWKMARQHLHDRLGIQKFHAWFKKIDFVKQDEGMIILVAPTRFIADWVMKHHRKDLLWAWQKIDATISHVQVKGRG